MSRRPASRGPLPLMKSLEDAVALCEKEQDNFYVTAFLIEAWLGELTMQTVAEYAEKKSASDRRLQTGEAHRLFQEVFGHVTDKEFPHVFQCICRFAEYDDPQSAMILGAFAALNCEHPPDTWPRVEAPLSCAQIIEVIQWMRQTVARLCEWLDAVNHRSTHRHYHLSPVSFHPDPHRRELATLGVNQRCYAYLSGFGKAWWEWHHSEAADRFKDSPKWPTVGKAMASDKTRRQKRPELDEAVICLWPLLKRHNWTYRDLLNVVIEVLPKHEDGPLDREHDLATYCNNVLGLRKQGEGSTTKDGKPPGYDAAMRLCGQKPS
jgi:hypothetical protein